MNLERLKELTADNEHLLALWFIAKEYRLDADVYADMVCEQLLAGEVSDDLNRRYLAATKELLSRIPKEEAEAVRLCL